MANLWASTGFYTEQYYHSFGVMFVTNSSGKYLAAKCSSIHQLPLVLSFAALCAKKRLTRGLYKCILHPQTFLLESEKYTLDGILSSSMHTCISQSFLGCFQGILFSKRYLNSCSRAMCWLHSMSHGNSQVTNNTQQIQCSINECMWWAVSLRSLHLS